MPRKGRVQVSEFGKCHAAYIARLVKLGAIFCRPCFAYLAVTHDCGAFRRVDIPAPHEARAFAAELRND